MTIQEDEIWGKENWELLNPGYSLQRQEGDGKPDWIDSKNGIQLEVTTAKLQNICEEEVFCKDNLGKDFTTIPKDSLQKLKKDGCFLAFERKDKNGNRSGKAISYGSVFGREGIEEIYNAIRKKYQKNYLPLNRLDLYVIAELICPSSLSDNDFKKVISLAEQYNITDGFVNGATRQKLTQAAMRKMHIPDLSIDEQLFVVKMLNEVNAIITARQRELQALDDLVKARFVEMFGDLKLNPKGWNLHSFEELSDVITDGEHATPRRTTEGVYLLSARNILNHAIQLDDVDYIDQDEYDRISKRIVPQEDDILISCSGSVGRCCSVPAGLKFQMVRSVALVRFKEEISPKFAEYMITSDFVQDQINAAKTASSQANLFQGKIAKLQGFVPPIALQKQFEQFVSQVDKSKFAVQKALNQAQLLFDSLMQKYFG